MTGRPQTWQRAPAACAVANVLAALSEHVATRKPTAEASVLVCSYEEDFDDLWRLEGSLFEWLRAGDRHVVLVRNGASVMERPETSCPEWYLGPEGWAAALTLALFGRADEGEIGDHVDFGARIPAWRVSILDFAPSGKGPPPIGTGAALAPSAGLLPHVEIWCPWELRGFFQKIQNPSAAALSMPGGEDLEELRQWWCSLRLDTRGGRRTAGDASLSHLRRAARWAYEKALAEENRRFRHGKGDGFGAFLPAVRLLLGGMHAGALSFERALEILAAIRQQQPQAPEGREYNFGLLKRYWKLLERLDELPNRERGRHGRRRYRLLLVDDEHKTAGWDLVVPDLLPEWHVDVGSPAALDEKLEQDKTLPGYDLVLIDYFLGSEESRDGLDLVAKLRNHHPFIPAVLFTGVDDSMLYQEALAAGATAYFVKELVDTDDRDSAQYFLALQRLMDKFLEMDREGPFALLEAWKRLPPYATATRRGSAISTRGDELAAQVVSGLERALFWWAVAVQSPGARRPQFYRAVGIALYHGLDALDTLRMSKCGVSKDTLESQNKGLRKFARKARHGEPLTRVDSNRIKGHFHGMLDRCAEVQIQAVHQEGNVARVGAVARAPRKTDTGRTSHERRSVSGAVRFLLGYYAALGADEEILTGWEPKEGLADRDYVADLVGLFGDFESRAAAKVPPSSALRLALLVDDTADRDGWALALRTGLQDTVIRHLRYEGSGNDTDIVKYSATSDVILLDLRMPALPGGPPREEEGLRVLRLIRQTVPDLPVVVLSANEDLLSARRCLGGISGLNAGGAAAIAYYSKTWRPLPRGAGPERIEFYKAYYEGFCKVLQFEGPQTNVGPLLSVCARLRGRGRRHRSESDVSSRLSDLMDFVRTAAWIQGDRHLRWLFERLVHALKATKSGDDLVLPEAAVCVTALAEFLLRDAIDRSGCPRMIDLSEAALRSLIGEAKRIGIISRGQENELEDLNSIRDGVLYPKDAKRDGGPPTFAELIQVAARLLPQLVEVLMVAGSGPPDPSGLAASLRASFASRYPGDGPEIDRTPLRRYKNGIVTLKSAYAKASRAVDDAEVAHQVSLRNHQAAQRKLEGLQADMNLRLTQVAGDQRTAGRVQETFAPKVREAQEGIKRIGQSADVHRMRADSARAKAEAAKSSLRASEAAIPDVPGILMRRRWEAARGWIEERAAEERASSAMGEPPGPCWWEEEPLSRQVDEVVTTLSTNGCGYDSIWTGIKAWIDGASVEDSVIRALQGGGSRPEPGADRPGT